MLSIIQSLSEQRGGCGAGERHPRGTLVTSQAAAVEEQVWYTSAKN